MYDINRSILTEPRVKIFVLLLFIDDCRNKCFYRVGYSGWKIKIDHKKLISSIGVIVILLSLKLAEFY